jgi:D-alanyl-D-alanine dipeptidase
MTILLSDPRVTTVPVHDNGEPLVRLDGSFGPARALVRRSLARRLVRAQAELPSGMLFRVVEGYRCAADQQAIITSYTAQLTRARPELTTEDLQRLCSRFVAPLEVAPHVAGASVDLTLADVNGRDLDLGTPIDATPEDSDGRCYFAAKVPNGARANRTRLGRLLRGAGLVNYPTEWWHWSYGDRYWALMTGAPAALYGPVDASAVAA